MVLWFNHFLSVIIKLEIDVLIVRWTCPVKTTQTLLGCSPRGWLAGPTLQLDSSLILNSKIRDFPLRQVHLSHRRSAETTTFANLNGWFAPNYRKGNIDLVFNGRTLKCFLNSFTETSKFNNKMPVWLVLTCECCFGTGFDNTKQLLLA